jgi:hypothetical protein
MCCARISCAFRCRGADVRCCRKRTSPFPDASRAIRSCHP